MKKNLWISVLAGVAAVAAAAVAVALLIRKKSKALAERLDCDPDDFFDSDEECDGCCSCCDASGDCEMSDAPHFEEVEEDTLPLHPDETAPVESEAVPAEEEPAKSDDSEDFKF